MINYSIIIPHKNIPHLLQRCLDSIPRREDVQIIVVDDNSDTDKVDFANFPGLNDPYVEVVFGKNENDRKGAGYARNLGLEKAKGKWLVFADADDFFMPCFDEVLDKYVNDENDIIYFKITSVDLDTLQPATRHQYIIDCLEQIQKNNDWDLACLLVTPWGSFIKREIVKNNNIVFSEVQWGNDVYFAVKASLAKNKSIAEEEIYCVTSRGGSLTKQDSAKSLTVRFKEVYKAIAYLEKMRKRHYLTGALSNCWFRISDISILQSILLLPKMIKACGIRRTMACIKRSKNFTIKRLIKK